MKYFIDTEFHERQINGIDTIELISLGIVCEDGREFYVISNEFDYYAAVDNKWLNDNVLNSIIGYRFMWQSKEDIKNKLLSFAPPDTNPEFYGYYCDYDWVVFCWLFGRMIDLPKGYPMYCKDLKQDFDLFYPDSVGEEMKQNPKYPKQENEHNALSDAKWNYELYKFINHDS